jgi:tetratricopeptide (TPR) repeat protein
MKRTTTQPAALLVAGALALGIAGAQPSPRPQIDSSGTSSVTVARQALGAGDTGRAIELLQQWLASHPHDVSARATLGDAFRASGDATRAESEYQAVLKERPDSVEALAALGLLFEQSGRSEKAEPLLAQAAKLSHDSAAIRMEWAGVLARLHRYAEAAAALRGLPAPKAVPGHIAYLRLKASVDAGNGDARAAAGDMEQAVSLAPKDQDLILATGIAETAAQDWTKAIQHLTTVFATTHDLRAGLALLEAQVATRASYGSTLAALRASGLPPKQDAQLRARVGEILSQAGFHQEAVQEFQGAVQDAPDDPDLYFDLALGQLRSEQLDAALENAKRAKAIRDSAATESLLGEIFEKRGDSLEAVHSYQAAVELDPYGEQNRLALGLELLQHKTFEPALVVFQQASQLFPRSKRVQVALGLTYYFLERYAEAAHTFLAAAASDPSPALIYGYLGEIQLQQPVTPDPAAIQSLCRYAEAHTSDSKAVAYCGALLLRTERDCGDTAPSARAINLLRDSARTDPKDTVAQCELGKALEWTQQWQGARSAMEACVRLAPDSAEAHYRLASIYRHLGETELAQKQISLHDEATRRVVESNAHRDSTLKEFLYSIKGQVPAQ